MEEQEKQTEYMRGVPPHDETAEQAVLCSMFLDREAASVALEVRVGRIFIAPTIAWFLKRRRNYIVPALPLM